MNLFCSLVSLFVIVITLSLAPNASQAQKHTAFFIFGDSSVDTGNNNYIDTTPENQANYPPYGRKGPDPDQPTGRFSDGRVFVDFIAEYAQLPSIPSMLAPPRIKEYKFGVNFGSGGAGVLSSTNRDQGVIDLNTQLKYFEEVERKLKKRLGDDKARKIISNAVYFFSIGSSDYLSGYISNPEMIQPYPNPYEYVDMVVGNLTNIIRGLYDKGARKFGFLNLPALGCLPFMKALHDLPSDKTCLDYPNALADKHNSDLIKVLEELFKVLPDFKYSFGDLYDWLGYLMRDPSDSGFKEGLKACCGIGFFNGIYSCGGKKNVTTMYNVCDNGDDYVFWDSLHLTEKAHEGLAKFLWEGSTMFFQGRYTLRQLFLNNNNNNMNNHHVIVAAAAEAA